MLNKLITTFFTVTLLLLFCATANASTYASPVFESCYVLLNSSLEAEVSASLQLDCDTVYVKSAILQRVNKNGSTVYSSKAILPTTKTSYNVSDYTDWMDFSKHAEHGNYYRVRITFYADGYTSTATSAVVYY